MKRFISSFQVFIASLLLLTTVSCEKSEMETIDKKRQQATKQKGPNSSSGKEKADVGTAFPQMWIPGTKVCVDIPYDCTAPIIITPELRPKQDNLDRAIATGTVQELDASLFEKLFPELPNDEIDGILSGDIGLCRAHNEEERTSFYIGYDKGAGIECEEAKNEKEARKWVLQTQDQE